MKIEISLDDKIANILINTLPNKDLRNFIEDRVLEEIEDYLLAIQMKGKDETISYNDGMKILKAKLGN